MKRSILLSLAGLTALAACMDSPTRPTDAVVAPQGALKPLGPVKDDIANKLDATVDAIVEVMPLTVGGASGTTQLVVSARNDDEKNGCNFQGPTASLVLSVSSSNTAVATVSPSSVTFGNCGDVRTLTVTPGIAGSARISLTQTSNNTGTTFTLAPATFDVNVTAPTPANTAPSISISGVATGSSYNKGSVPVATCEITDAEDGNSTKPATLSLITGTYASDGIGSQTASCSYTDGGGLTAVSSVTYSIIDPSAPSFSFVLSPATPDGSNDWYTSAVTLTWTVTENESPNSLTKTGCVDQNITADQTETTYSCSATSAGGSATQVDVKIKRDGTAPTKNVTRLPAANGFGWNNTAVKVSYGWDDATSGLATCSADEEFTTEGSGQSASGTCADNAGNTASASVSDINIDLTKPTVSLVGGPVDGATYYFGSVPSAPTCSATDGLSGLDGTCAVSGYGAGIGTHTVKATAQDKAGNTSDVSVTYTVLAWTLKGFYQPIDMSPINGPIVYNTVKSGSTVPFKFEIFAGPTELTAVTSVASFATTPTSCALLAASDEIESTTTGGTSLRYDATGGQFIQNWQTTGKAGTCYKVTMIAQDGSNLVAYFKLK